jgi:hypothetical protein
MQRPGNTWFSLTDVHGAGAQRSSPKCGNYLGDTLGVDSLGNTVYGRGPQGDVLRVNNFVRLVRNFNSSSGINDIRGNDTHPVVYPDPFTTKTTIRIYPAVKIRNAVLEIYNTLGNNVRTISGINSGEINLERQNLSSGMYFYTIACGTLRLTGKFVIE